MTKEEQNQNEEVELEEPAELASPIPPKKSWLSAHHALGFLFLFMSFAAVVSATYYYQLYQDSKFPFIPVIHRDPYKDWKTYTNTEYGFEFKYPKKYDVLSAGREDLKSTKSIFLSDIGDDLNSPLTMHFDNEFATDWKDDSEGIVIRKETKIINAIEWIIVYFYDQNNPEQPYGKGAAVTQNNEAYFLVTGTDENYRNNEFDQILSTFKFIEPIPADWKTYTDSRYGFTFKYPSDSTITPSTFYPYLPSLNYGVSLNIKGPFVNNILMDILSLQSAQRIDENNQNCEGPCFTTNLAEDWVKDQSLFNRSSKAGVIDCQLPNNIENRKNYNCEIVFVNDIKFLLKYFPFQIQDQSPYKSYITYHDNLKYSFYVKNDDLLFIADKSKFEELEKTDNEIQIRNQILSTFKFTN